MNWSDISVNFVCKMSYINCAIFNLCMFILRSRIKSVRDIDECCSHVSIMALRSEQVKMANLGVWLAVCV